MICDFFCHIFSQTFEIFIWPYSAYRGHWLCVTLWCTPQPTLQAETQQLCSLSWSALYSSLTAITCTAKSSFGYRSTTPFNRSTVLVPLYMHGKGIDVLIDSASVGGDMAPFTLLGLAFSRLIYYVTYVKK